ncbi:helix-turn-helix transcriptional regulator [uncultured Cohaesibacter sp.]|uniref:helix-turn-helix transcriptional regulator n=1 Tax=uncultured Cohaesibacter sp. TaxID=1002546 RepID=UPI0029C80015|nr:helix-turn-helix transcriptional regulator [uncultured Cohaesibacter sp.]
MTTNTEESKFTRYIRSKIEASEKSQRELAELVGYNNQNMIAMLKTGGVKLALDRVPAMAQALKVDPLDLFKIALTQFYDEDTCKALLGIIEADLSPVEREILEIVRASSSGTPELTEEQKKKLTDLFS